MAKKTKKAALPPATAREVRIWASENGHEVSVRGRLSKDVRKAFTDATGREIA